MEDRLIQHKLELCERAGDAEWESTVSLTRQLTNYQKLYLQEHPPGLVKALWEHFAATRDSCGCATPSHERNDCTVPLIERLVLEIEAA